MSLVLSSLTLNSLSGLGDSMSVSQGILFDLNDSVLVGVLVVSSSDSSASAVSVTSRHPVRGSIITSSKMNTLSVVMVIRDA